MMHGNGHPFPHFHVEEVNPSLWHVRFMNQGFDSEVSGPHGRLIALARASRLNVALHGDEYAALHPVRETPHHSITQAEAVPL